MSKLFTKKMIWFCTQAWDLAVLPVPSAEYNLCKLFPYKPFIQHQPPHTFPFILVMKRSASGLGSLGLISNGLSVQSSPPRCRAFGSTRNMKRERLLYVIYF